MARKKVSADAIEAMMAPYTQATAAAALNAAFSGLHPDRATAIDRGNLIIIDGKTPKEIAIEQYRNDPRSEEPNASFDKFFRENGDRLTSELVSSALMAGKRVEAFLPNKDGSIPAEPTRLTKSGYDPKPLKKVRLNRWEKFWNKMGFYQKKAEKAAEYRKWEEARGRVKLYNRVDQFHSDLKTSEWMKNTLFSEWRAAHPGKAIPPERGASELSVTRSAIQSLVIADLVSKGHSISDILDPNKLKNERLASVDAVYEHTVTKADYPWIGELMARGLRAVIDAGNAAAKKLDLSKPDAIMQDGFRDFQRVSNVAFDLSQEINRPNVRAAVIQLQGEEGFKQLYNESNDLGAVPDFIVKGAEAESRLLLGVNANNDISLRSDMLFAAQGIAARSVAGARAKTHPELPLSRLIPFNDTLVPSVGALAYHSSSPSSAFKKQLDGLMEEYHADPSSLRSAIATNKINDRISYTYRPEITRANSTKVNPPITVKPAEGLQAPVKTAKAAPAGPRL